MAIGGGGVVCPRVGQVMHSSRAPASGRPKRDPRAAVIVGQNAKGPAALPLWAAAEGIAAPTGIAIMRWTRRLVRPTEVLIAVREAAEVLSPSGAAFPRLDHRFPPSASQGRRLEISP